MTYAQNIIRSHELSAYRNGSTASITLAGSYVPSCEYDDDLRASDCVNAVCRNSNTCTLSGDATRRLH